MRGQRFLNLPLRIGTAVRTMLTTIRYFAGLLPGPKWLYFELVNTCNADCVFCAYRYDKREKRTLSTDAISRAADQFKRMGGKNIGLSPTFGETFVDQNAVKKIQVLERIGFESIHTYTNGSLLHKFGVENVLRSGLTALRISMPPLEASLYRKIYQNGNYQRVLDNVRDLLIAFSAIP